MRLLTTRFLTYTIDQYEKKNNCVLLDALDIGNLSVSKILDLMILGNGPNFSREDASKKFDEYLYADESRSDITAFLDLLSELDTDRHTLKSVGISVDDIKAQFEEEVKSKTANIIEKISSDQEVEQEIEGDTMPSTGTNIHLVEEVPDIN